MNNENVLIQDPELNALDLGSQDFDNLDFDNLDFNALLGPDDGLASSTVDTGPTMGSQPAETGLGGGAPMCMGGAVHQNWVGNATLGPDSMGSGFVFPAQPMPMPIPMPAQNQGAYNFGAGDISQFQSMLGGGPVGGNAVMMAAGGFNGKFRPALRSRPASDDLILI